VDSHEEKGENLDMKKGMGGAKGRAAKKTPLEEWKKKKKGKGTNAGCRNGTSRVSNGAGRKDVEEETDKSSEKKGHFTVGKKKEKGKKRKEHL